MKTFNYKNIFFCVLVLFCFTIQQRANTIDSIRTLISKANSDTVKINLRLKLLDEILSKDSTEAFFESTDIIKTCLTKTNPQYTLRTFSKIEGLFYRKKLFNRATLVLKEAILFARLKQSSEWQSLYFLELGDIYQFLGLSKSAIKYFDSIKPLLNEISDKSKASYFMNYGRCHYDLGDYKTAMDCYIQAQTLFEKNNWRNKDFGHLMHYLGSVFKRQSLYDKALSYYEKEYTIAKEINDQSLMAEALYLSAAMHGTKGDLDKELELLEESIRIYKEMNNDRMVALLYGNISASYSDKGEYQKALDYCFMSLDLYKLLEKSESLVWVYKAIAQNYSNMGKHEKAMEYFNLALKALVNIETKRTLFQSEIKESMAFAYYRAGKYKLAFDTYQEYRHIDDSLNSSENKEYLQNLEKQYETEKKEQQITLLNKDNKMHKLEIDRKNGQRNTLIIVIVLSLMAASIAVFAYFNNRKKSMLLAERVEEINLKNLVIQEKNKDITDSIQYAKRLQDAVFPDPNELNRFFSDAFVLFRPKDIVSGDFYWFEIFDNKALIVVGDCTGHGVPGAFMSIMGHNLLNQLVMEEGITDPALLLSLLDKKVTQTLNKKGTINDRHDGMDMAICLINKEASTITFAGANRPLLINRAGKIDEYKPDKFALGGLLQDNEKLFHNKTIEIHSSDTIYMFSDGYQDQFGGPKGKKLKYRYLQDLLVTKANENLKEQAEKLDKVFEEWRGKLEQIDDVTVVGIRI